MNNEYINRINKTLDYIERNIRHPFTLDELAEIACFSKYHFNRIFYALVKETPFRLRMSVCITVPPETKTDGKVGKMKIEGGDYVVARFELTANDFAKAWQWVYAEWFPASGYQPDDKPAFELYPEEPKNGKFTVDICVPVKPL